VSHHKRYTTVFKKSAVFREKKRGLLLYFKKGLLYLVMPYPEKWGVCVLLISL